MARERRPFLTATWRHLAMLNYRVDPDLLAPLVPRGTELDAHDGVTYVSIVGFLFTDTRVLGIPIPFHRDFEELNLRFYVRRTVGEEVRRGVVFVKELVPRRAIALVARLAYNEPYDARRMSHHFAKSATKSLYVSYSWQQHGGDWAHLSLTTAGKPQPLVPGSREEFITEHYWGYTRQRDASTVEYQVQHPPWRVWSADRVVLEADAEELYGRAFADVMDGTPSSAFLAEGSAVSVSTPVHL